MGLKMYLTGSRNLSINKPTEKNLSEEISNLINTPKPVVRIKIEIMYWRKARQIHNWFVENVQDGVDDGKEYYVSTYRLEELRNTCREVLADHSKAEYLLPPSKGLSFDSTEIDEYYFETLKNTVDELTNLLESPIYKYYHFYYLSKWQSVKPGP